MPEENRFEFSNFREVFGNLQSAHRVRRSKFEIVVIPSIIFLLFLFGVITYIASEDILAIPVCVIVPFLLFCGLVWHLFSTGKDELKIYQNGFTYKSKKRTQACLWKDIKIYHRRERTDQEISELEEGIFPIGAVEKKNGEIIDFTDGMQQMAEIVRCFEKYAKK
jgi:hypothetical protein